MKLQNETYDKLKWFVSVFIPALIMLLGTLGKIYEWTFTDNLTLTISAIGTFLGAIFMISSVNYKKTGDD